MLIILLNLLIWIPAVAGFGSILVSVRRKISTGPRMLEYEMVEPFFGLMILSTVATALNLLFAIDDQIAAALLLTGWVLCWFRFRSIPKIRLHPGWLLFLFGWLLFVSFWATQQPLNPDSGWYHVPSIRWANENPVPLGLANFHPAFGYNSLWFTLAAVLKLPFSGIEEVNSYTISVVS